MKFEETKFSKASKTIGGLFLAVIYLVPIIMLLLASFKTQKNVLKDILGWPNPFITKNYPAVVEKMGYGRALWNSVYITVVSTVIICICSSMAAWVLVRYKTKASKIIFMMFSLSMLIPFQCVMIPLMSVLGGKGLNMMNPGGLIFAYLGFGSAMSIMLYHGFIKGIPVELEESAAIDGCGMFQTFWKIVFPLLSPITTTVGILNIMWIWNDYLLPSLVIGAKQEWRTLPLKTFYFFGAFSSRWDYASAALILSMIPIVIFYMIAQKWIIKGVVDGAIK